jgi:hypothetical protein
MKFLTKRSGRTSKRFCLGALFTIAVLSAACADRPSPDASGVRSNEPPYPVLLTDSADRQETALADWTKLSREQNVPINPPPTLQPITATIRSLPPGTVLRMQKLGADETLSEEEIRESLRRFIASASNLLGAEPQQLSLVKRTDLADGTKKAHYEQRPFRFPLRGEFGSLDITFSPDRRILQVSSTCIPDVELLQRAAVGIRAKWPSDKLSEHVVGKTFSYVDAAGVQQTLAVTKDESLTIHELLIYPILRKPSSTVLEFHLCWEISVGTGSNSKRIYLDAVTDEVLAVQAPTS